VTPEATRLAAHNFATFLDGLPQSVVRREPAMAAEHADIAEDFPPLVCRSHPVDDYRGHEAIAAWGFERASVDPKVPFISFLEMHRLPQGQRNAAA